MYQELCKEKVELHRGKVELSGGKVDTILSAPAKDTTELARWCEGGRGNCACRPSDAAAGRAEGKGGGSAREGGPLAREGVRGRDRRQGGQEVCWESWRGMQRAGVGRL